VSVTPLDSALNRLQLIKRRIMSNSPARKYLTEDELKQLLIVVRGKKLPGMRQSSSSPTGAACASEFDGIPSSVWNQSRRRLFVTRIKGSLAGEFTLSKAEQPGGMAPQ
jgi:hypothetical protein